MFVITRKIFILFSLIGLSLGLIACTEEERDRVLRYEKRDVSWKGRSAVVSRSVTSVDASLKWPTYILVFAFFKVGRLSNMFLRYLSVLTVLFALSIGSFSALTPAIAQTKGEVPGAALGIKSDSDLWRYVRTENAGTSQMKNELAGVMINLRVTIGVHSGTDLYLFTVHTVWPVSLVY